MKKYLYILILLSAATLTAHAQATLTGTITDAATGEPLISVQVYVKSAKKAAGTITDLEGNFRLETKESLPLTLSVEYIGYRTQEIDVYDDSEPIDIQLNEEVNKLSEVVVIGYGTQKRTQLTGSVTTVNADILENSRQATIDAALSGQVSGLNVTASSGQPGAESHIRIRGGVRFVRAAGVRTRTDVHDAVGPRVRGRWRVVCRAFDSQEHHDAPGGQKYALRLRGGTACRLAAVKGGGSPLVGQGFRRRLHVDARGVRHSRGFSVGDERRTEEGVPRTREAEPSGRAARARSAGGACEEGEREDGARQRRLVDRQARARSLRISRQPGERKRKT